MATRPLAYLLCIVEILSISTVNFEHFMIRVHSDDMFVWWGEVREFICCPKEFSEKFEKHEIGRVEDDVILTVSPVKGYVTWNKQQKNYGKTLNSITGIASLAFFCQTMGLQK